MLTLHRIILYLSVLFISTRMQPTCPETSMQNIKCNAGWNCTSKFLMEQIAQKGDSDLVAVHWAQWGGQCFGRGVKDLQHLLTCAPREDQRVNTDILLPCINSSRETDTEWEREKESASDWDINYINQTVWNMTILIMSRQSIRGGALNREWERGRGRA